MVTLHLHNYLYFLKSSYLYIVGFNVIVVRELYLHKYMTYIHYVELLWQYIYDVISVSVFTIIIC